jgi:hypothetical protein
MNPKPNDSQSEIFYRAASAEELVAIRQTNGLVLVQTELFITQDMEWVAEYVRRSKAGNYDFIVAITTQQGTTDWLLSVGKRHGSQAAKIRFPNHAPLIRGDRNSVHLKEQSGVVTYGLRTGVIAEFNRRIRRIEVAKTL